MHKNGNTSIHILFQFLKTYCTTDNFKVFWGRQWQSNWTNFLRWNQKNERGRKMRGKERYCGTILRTKQIWKYNFKFRHNKHQSILTCSGLRQGKETQEASLKIWTEGAGTNQTTTTKIKSKSTATSFTLGRSLNDAFL